MLQVELADSIKLREVNLEEVISIREFDKTEVLIAPPELP
jgi:hypothetical protein